MYPHLTANWKQKWRAPNGDQAAFIFDKLPPLDSDGSSQASSLQVTEDSPSQTRYTKDAESSPFQAPYSQVTQDQSAPGTADISVSTVSFVVCILAVAVFGAVRVRVREKAALPS